MLLPSNVICWAARAAASGVFEEAFRNLLLEKTRCLVGSHWKEFEKETYFQLDDAEKKMKTSIMELKTGK